jgi:nucleoside-diphosphate-sugar epimerase
MALGEHARYPPLIVNVGSPSAVTIDDLANRIIDLTGKRIEIKHDRTKPTSPPGRIASIEKARAELNWGPRVSLDEGLVRTYNWLADTIESS